VTVDDATNPKPDKPKKGQERTAFDPSSGPGDSPPLPPGLESQFEEGVKDQRYRRMFRASLVSGVLTTLALLAVNLTYVIFSTTDVYTSAIKQHAAAATTLHTAAAHDGAKASGVVVGATSSVAGAPSAVAVATSSASSVTSPKDKSKPEARVLERTVEAEPHSSPIFGEMKDALIPIVAMVSVLAASIVVILVTALKASFAPTKTGGEKAGQESNEIGPAFPSPVIEAITNLIDAVKGVVTK
jgi:Mn2+/Fe2+ NRAMP family transporter